MPTQAASTCSAYLAYSRTAGRAASIQNTCEPSRSMHINLPLRRLPMVFLSRVCARLFCAEWVLMVMSSSTVVMQTGWAGVRMGTRVEVCLHVKEVSQQQLSEHRQPSMQTSFSHHEKGRVLLQLSLTSHTSSPLSWRGQGQAQRNDGFTERGWNTSCWRGRCLLEQTQQALHKSETKL